jgi:hypothetical protein
MVVTVPSHPVAGEDFVLYFNRNVSETLRCDKRGCGRSGCGRNGSGRNGCEKRFGSCAFEV